MTSFGEVLSGGNNNYRVDPTLRLKRLFMWGGAVLVAIVTVSLFFNYILSITRIGAGHVGVEVVLSGSQRGASEIPIRTGWVFYSPIRSQIIEFPTYVQTVKWTRRSTKETAATRR